MKMLLLNTSAGLKPMYDADYEEKKKLNKLLTMRYTKTKRKTRYTRPRSDDLYHTNRWTELAKAYKAAHPLCAECRKRGIIKAADCVDHIIPMPICRDFFYERSNLQSLCNDCNNAKGQRDKAMISRWRRKNRGVGGVNLSADFLQDPTTKKENAPPKYRPKVFTIEQIQNNGRNK